ncbi:MAG TPA: metallophosphoesterase [Chloroflexia bacterium]|nr:metallophosphoesterase [Chloroflexia bacterium]
MRIQLLLAMARAIKICLACAAITLLAACSSSSISGLPEAPTSGPAATREAVITPAGSKEGAAPSNTARPTAAAANTPRPRQTNTPERDTASDPTVAPPTPAPANGESAVLVGAGDIASCDSDQDEKTAKLLDGIAGTVFTLGDNVYDDGSSSEYKECYDPTWGRHKARTRPAPGNHDYRTSDAKAYFGYFGEVVGKQGEGYYSYDLGAWHIVVLNSNCKAIGGCDADSRQVRWLEEDLAENPAHCTLAYWHHPRFSSGKYENNQEIRPLWQTLYDAGAEIIMSGHDHNYQRYAPQDPAGKADPARGIRQFVVGTGGKSLYDIEKPNANREAASDKAYGVLKLTLNATSYEWEFIATERGRFTDSGSGTCH